MSVYFIQFGMRCCIGLYLCSVFLRIDREKMKLDQLKIDALERDRLRLESELLDLKRRVDREREDLKRIETLRFV